MSITDKLEGLLPASGDYTKNERIIAEAVEVLRCAEVTIELLASDTVARVDRMGDNKPWKLAALAFIAGAALAMLVVGAW